MRPRPAYHAEGIARRPERLLQESYTLTCTAADGTVLGTTKVLVDKGDVANISPCTSGGVGGTVPATLSLTLGAPGTFGAFMPGVAKDYTASTTATVISTAGDATLTVADPSATATGHLVNGTFSLPQALQTRAGPERMLRSAAPPARRASSPGRPRCRTSSSRSSSSSRSARRTRCVPAPTPRR